MPARQEDGVKALSLNIFELCRIFQQFKDVGPFGNRGIIKAVGINWHCAALGAGNGYGEACLCQRNIGNRDFFKPHTCFSAVGQGIGARRNHVYRAFAAQCPHAALCEGYGVTECSPVVSVNRPGDIVCGTIGHAMPSVTLALVREEDGNICGRVEAGQTGMLLVRGPSIFGGYLSDAPSPFVEFEGHTWYRTGDLVRLDETGRLTFQGRLKRFVKIGGEMISLPQIESVLLEIFGKRGDAPEQGPALAVEATAEESGSAIMLFTPMALSLPEVNAALRGAGLSSLYAIKRIVNVEAIPLLGSGKTDYRALKGSVDAV